MFLISFIIILKYLGFNVYYIYIGTNNDTKKNKIATKLKKINIFPLPIEFEKKISNNGPFSLCEEDPGEIAYNKNIKLVPDAILKKYCSLFSISNERTKKLRKTSN